MMQAIAASTIVLGAVTGTIIARYVEDETGWYTSHFFLAASSLMVAAAFVHFIFPSSYDPFLSFWASIILAGIYIVALHKKSVLLTALTASAMALIGGIGVWQLVMLSLIPATGYLYTHIQKKALWWFLLVPTIIIPWTLLV